MYVYKHSEIIEYVKNCTMCYETTFSSEYVFEVGLPLIKSLYYVLWNNFLFEVGLPFKIWLRSIEYVKKTIEYVKN